MLLGIFLIFVALITGVLITYLYDDDSWGIERVLEGFFIGSSLLGISGFIIASLIGLNTESLILSAGFILLPAFILSYKKKEKLIAHDLNYLRTKLGSTIRKPAKLIFISIFLIIIFALLANVLSGSMIEEPSGIYTTSYDNYADLTLHVGIITSFTQGENFPPIHPDYAGARLTYPFLVDFLAAMMVKGGMTIAWAINIQNFLFISGFIFLLYVWVLRLTANKFAGSITPAIFLLSGGMGWLMIINEIKGVNPIDFLMNLPHDYSIYGEKIRWGNPIVYWFITMRGMLLGIPLFIIVANIWWRVISGLRVKGKGESAKNNTRIMIGAGMITALLPLVHTHSFLALMFVAVFLSLIFRKYFREWIVFFISAAVFSLPQIIWLAVDSSVKASTFFGFLKGWLPAEPNFIWLWFNNTGLFIPLIVLAFLVPGLIKKNLKLFYLPFILLFIIPNFIKLAPWEWDNIKILALWYIFSLPLVTLFLHYLWKKHLLLRLVSIILIFSLVLSGSLDLWRMITGVSKVQVFDSNTLKMADVISRSTVPKSLILSSPIHNSPMLLTGRQTFMGYPGRVWSHGMEYAQREEDIRQMYQGNEDFLKKYKIEYVLVGDSERYWLSEQSLTLNEEFFEQFELIDQVDQNKIYKVNGVN